MGVVFEKFVERFTAEEMSLRELRQALGKTRARQWNNQASVFITEEQGRTIESTE